MQSPGVSGSASFAPPLRRAAARCCAGLAVAAAGALAAGIHGLVFLVLESGGPIGTMLELAPRLPCAVLRACAP